MELGVKAEGLPGRGSDLGAELRAGFLGWTGRENLLVERTAAQRQRAHTD